MDKKIMALHEDENELLYRITCSCTDPDHDVDIMFERNKDHGPYGFTMSMSTRIKAADYSLYKPTRWETFWGIVQWRIKNALKILFTGKVEAYHEFYLDKDNIKAFETAINNAKKAYTESSF
jgi:hypothetical protein